VFSNAVDRHDVSDPSVYQRVLGEQFENLDPQLQRYFAGIPAGRVGRGEGTFVRAGLRRRWLRPFFALLARRRIAFGDRGLDVPFTVRNTPCADGTLRAVRTIRFPHRARVIEDRMSVVDGTLRDRLGRAGELEIELHLSVRDGGLEMRSGRMWVRIGVVRLRLLPIVRVSLGERAMPGSPGRQHVDLRVGMPVIGEVFGYRGDFGYVVTPLSAG
jgi:hypothetical protein